MYTYIALSRVPSTPACYRGTLGFKEKSECICCGHASGIFSPRPLWFGGCATHATPCSVPGYSYFRMCLENLNTSYLYNAAILASFFLFACLKACFRLSLSTRNKKKRTITSKKHAYRPETSYVLYYSLNSLVHKIRLHGRRGKGMAESFSRQKSRHAPQKEGGLKILCDLPPV